jgi:hypothetical protein
MWILKKKNLEQTILVRIYGSLMVKEYLVYVRIGHVVLFEITREEITPPPPGRSVHSESKFPGTYSSSIQSVSHWYIFGTLVSIDKY